MKSLIINADDLGFSPQVNAAIVHGANAQRITAASLMVNMPYAEEAAQEVQKSCPDLSLGLHFTLSCGKALASPELLPNLTDSSSGKFKVGFLQIWRTVPREEIQREFDAQMETMLRLAEKYRLKFDHLDSHQHIHVLPGIFELLRSEAEKRNLVLRVPRERVLGFRRFSRRWSQWIPGGILKCSILNHFLRNAEQKIGYFGILETGKVDLNALKAILAALEAALKSDEPGFGIYELNTHPSLGTDSANASPTNASPADAKFHRCAWRKIEYEALMSPEFSSVLEKSRVRLKGFS